MTHAKEDGEKKSQDEQAAHWLEVIAQEEAAQQRATRKPADEGVLAEAQLVALELRSEQGSQSATEELEKMRPGLLETMRTAEASRQNADAEKTEQAKMLIEETETILEKWTAQETLGALIALVTEAEAMASPLRTEAKLALRDLKTNLDTLKKNGSSAYDALEARRSVLGKAVGMINSGKVDHTRG